MGIERLQIAPKAFFSHFRRACVNNSSIREGSNRIILKNQLVHQMQEIPHTARLPAPNEYSPRPRPVNEPATIDTPTGSHSLERALSLSLALSSSQRLKTKPRRLQKLRLTFAPRDTPRVCTTRSHQFETRLVEAGFLMLLAVAAGALHYSYSFHSPLPEYTGAPVRHDPVSNYLLVLGIAAAAYLGTRFACDTIVAVVPDSIKGRKFLRTGTYTAAALACAYAVYVVAGSPTLDDHVLVKWAARNWEQRGRQDAEWCLRLLVLLMCCQALLGAVTMAYRTAWWMLGIVAKVLVFPWAYAMGLLRGGADEGETSPGEAMSESSDSRKLGDGAGGSEYVAAPSPEISEEDEEKDEDEDEGDEDSGER